MTCRRSIGSVLVLLACCLATMASTASATIPAPPGGPILVVTPASADEFGNYVPEILRGEGLNEFDVATSVGQPGARSLAATTSSCSRAPRSAMPRWRCSPTGSARRQPDRDAPRREARRRCSGSPPPAAPPRRRTCRSTRPRRPAAGITGRRCSSTAPPTATRWRRDAGGDAVLGRQHGHGQPGRDACAASAAGGQAAAFTYDLARSVVYTRQGNPAWAGQERDDGTSGPIRSDDLFFGKAGDGSPTGSTSPRSRSRRPTSSSGCWPT